VAATSPAGIHKSGPGQWPHPLGRLRKQTGPDLSRSGSPQLAEKELFFRSPVACWVLLLSAAADLLHTWPKISQEICFPCRRRHAPRIRLVGWRQVAREMPRRDRALWSVYLWTLWTDPIGGPGRECAFRLNWSCSVRWGWRWIAQVAAGERGSKSLTIAATISGYIYLKRI
jgi:hypothetical protein